MERLSVVIIEHHGEIKCFSHDLLALFYSKCVCSLPERTQIKFFSILFELMKLVR